MSIYSVLLFFLVIAAWQDYHYQKISNILVLFMLVTGIGSCYLLRINIFSGLMTMAEAFLLLFFLFLIRVIGAGDVKLLCAAALYLRKGLWWCIAGTFVLAAMIGILILWQKQLLWIRLKSAFCYLYTSVQKQKIGEYCYGTQSDYSITVPLAPCFLAAHIMQLLYYLWQKGGAY